MSDYDGSIKLSVSLDPKEIQKSARDMEDKISKVFKAAEGKNVSSGFQKIMTNMDKATVKAESLRQKMDDLRTVKSPEYSKLETELGKAESALKTLINARESLRTQGSMTAEDEQDLEILNNQIDSTIVKIDELKSEMDMVLAEGNALIPEPKNEEAYSRLASKLNGVVNQERILYEAAKQTGDGVVQDAEKMGDANEQAAARSSDVWKNTGNLIKKSFTDLATGKLFKPMAAGAVEAAKKIGSAFTAAGLKIKDLIKHAKDSPNAFNKMGTSIGSVIRKLGMLGLGIGSVVVLFRKIRGAVTEGLQAMAQWNGGNNAANQSISMLISSLNYLKASLGAAFAPILTVVAPILSAFMDMLARAAQMVGAFFAALTGKSTYVTATKMQTNYAASQGKATAKTKKDTKETKKNTKAKKDNAKATKDQNDKLADFDDLNVLGIEDQEALNDALDDQPEIETPEIETPEMPGGGGGGGAPIAGFQEKDIPDWIKNLVDKIKDAWKNADFTEIGRIVGSKLRDALWKAAEWLENVAQPIAYKIGKSLATFLNGFFETPGLATALGRAIGELINTAIIGINAFLDNTHWKSIGEFIGKGLNAAILTIDWAGLGHMLAQGINALFGVLLGFVTTFNFRQFGQAIGTGLSQAIRDIDVKQIFAVLSNGLAGIIEFISGVIQGLDWRLLGNNLLQWIIDAYTGINWARITAALAELLGSAIGALLSFATGIGEKIVQLITAAFNYAKQWFYKVAFENGKFTITGLLQGIIDALKSIGTWIVTNIFTPFINGFKAAFQIGSPSKVMEEMGKFLIEGLFNGIQSLVSTVIELWNSLKSKICEVWEAAKAKVIEITTNLRTTVESITSALKERAIALWTELKTKVETLVNTFKESIKSKINELKEKVQEHFTKLKEKSLEIWNNLKSEVENLVERFKAQISSIINALREAVLTHFRNLKSKALEIWNNLKSEVESLANRFKDTIAGENGIFAKMKDGLVGSNGIITNLKKKFIELIEKLRDGVKAPLNAILGFFGKLANGVISAVNSMIRALKGLSFTVPDWVPEIGGKEFNPFGALSELGSVSIPTLAQGAVIPPNKEFLAVLGDQKQGTNIEAPLDTMVSAFRTALSDMNIGTNNSSQNAIMTLDGQTFARLILPYVMDELGRRGYNVTVLQS